MNKHITAIKRLVIIAIPCLYFTLIPSYIVKWGISNNIPAFGNGTPFYEVFSVFSAAWIAAHIVSGVLLFGIYMMCYGCNKSRN